MNIDCRILGPREQFASDFERNWKSVKKIVRSLMPTNNSLYQPVHTYSGLKGKLDLASYLMSFRPIYQETSGIYIFPRLLTHIHVDPVRISGDLFLVISKLQNEIVGKLAESKKNSSEIFKQALIDYLKSSSVRFKQKMQGDSNRKSFTGLVPQVNDIIIYNDHTNQPRFGIIQKILEKNRVAVRTTHYKKINELVMHVRKISLIFRPSEYKGHFPLNLKEKSGQINSVLNQDINIDQFLELLK